MTRLRTLIRLSGLYGRDNMHRLGEWLDENDDPEASVGELVRRFLREVGGG